MDINRNKRGVAQLLGTFALGITLIASTGCGGSLQQQYTDAYGAGHQGASTPSVEVIQSGSTDVAVNGAIELASATVVFSSGETQTFAVDGTRAQLHCDTTAHLSYTKVQGKNGDYWFFDGEGTYLPDGYKPSFSVSAESEITGDKGVSGLSLVSTTLIIVSSDTMCQVKVAFHDDTVQSFYTNSIAESLSLAQSKPNVDAIMVKVLADGSKWYFDRNGLTLPLDSKWYTDLD
jgi:hypothetical protein